MPIPLRGPGSHEEPAELYRAMRRKHGPVAPILLDGDIPAWLVIGYRELHQVTGDPNLFSRDSELWNQWDNIPEDWPLRPVLNRGQPSILYTVGERHSRRAALLGAALDGIDPSVLRADCERFADELIDTFCTKGGADLVNEYAMQLPVRVLAHTYGFTEEAGRGLVTALTDMINAGDRALEGEAYLYRTAKELLADRRKSPADDVATRMLDYSPEFTEEETVQDLMILMSAGHQPTADWIGTSLHLMLTDARFAATMFGGRSSVAEAMNEVLWEQTPTQNMPGRYATRDTHLGGRRIGAGDLLILGIQGANSDPQIRTDASALTGGNSAHFSFSHGEHRCPFPAQEVSEVIARTGIEVVLDRLPDIDLAVPADSLKRRESPWLRGLTELPVTFAPTPALGGPDA
ncbi:cytochrome P450 [Streptomyces ruber]|uniref:Cytochrome P450 n=2 Tax=Streptomyces TaxID=1883 RepID=A0A918EN23_9ACTN|nr:cytochrome P450 [Streptomyces ruber]GGQ38009.1 cytochrome P450 [Streptomyces ruber]